MSVHKASGSREGFYKPGRKHQETKTQGIKEHLGEHAHVGDTFRPIVAPEGRKWSSQLMVLGIVFILNNPCPFSRHSIQGGPPTFQ